MQPLSAETYERLHQLWIRPSLIGRFVHEDPRIALLREIAGSGEVAAIPTLSLLLYSGDCRSKELVQATADAIAKLLKPSPSEVYRWLEDEQRHHFARYGTPDGSRWPGNSEFDFVQSPDSQAALWGMLSLHFNGYLRERAVRKLGTLDTEAALPFVLLRLNDWVVEVRVAALEVLESNSRLSTSTAIATYLDLVLRLADRHRADHSEVQKKLLDKLFQSAPDTIAQTIVNDPSSIVRRNGYRWGMENRPDIQPELVRRALVSCDPVVRACAIRDAHHILNRDENQGALSSALRDASPAVRREAVVALAQLDAGIVETPLHDAIFDRNRSVREIARYYLSKHGSVDFRQLYREQVMEGKRLPWSLFGLAEVGNQEDLPIFIMYSQNASPTLRLAAIRGIGRITESEGLLLLISALSDRAAKVAREAELSLTRNARGASLLDLEPLTQPHNLPHTRRAAVRLIDGLGSWLPVPLLIRMTADDDEVLAKLASTRLSHRVNRVWTKPNDSQRREIESALRNAPQFSTSLKDCYDWLLLNGT